MMNALLLRHQLNYNFLVNSFVKNIWKIIFDFMQHQNDDEDKAFNVNHLLSQIII